LGFAKYCQPRRKKSKGNITVKISENPIAKKKKPMTEKGDNADGEQKDNRCIPPLP